MGRLGFSEILVILIVGLLLFGGGRIADIGKGLGEGIRNFKKGLAGDDEAAPKPKPEIPPDEPVAKLPAKTAEKDG